MTNNSSQRVERMTYTDTEGDTVVIDHVPAKGFRAMAGTSALAVGMSARDLAAFTRTLRQNGYTLAEAV